MTSLNHYDSDTLLEENVKKKLISNMNLIYKNQRSNKIITLFLRKKKNKLKCCYQKTRLCLTAKRWKR